MGDRFTLWDQNPDQSAWIFYATRYDLSDLRKARKRILSVIRPSISFRQEGGKTVPLVHKGVGGRSLSQSEKLLLEELACINEALEFSIAYPVLCQIRLIETLSRMNAILSGEDQFAHIDFNTESIQVDFQKVVSALILDKDILSPEERNLLYDVSRKIHP